VWTVRPEPFPTAITPDVIRVRREHTPLPQAIQAARIHQKDITRQERAIPLKHNVRRDHTPAAQKVLIALCARQGMLRGLRDKLLVPSVRQVNTPPAQAIPAVQIVRRDHIPAAPEAANAHLAQRELIRVRQEKPLARHVRQENTPPVQGIQPAWTAREEKLAAVPEAVNARLARMDIIRMRKERPLVPHVLKDISPEEEP